MREFKDVLSELRTRRRLSQADLAKAVGMSAGSIGMYESGARKPSVEAQERLADYFNVSLDYLMGREQRSSYYLDPAVADMAQQAYDDPDTRLLLDAKRDLSEEDLDTVVSLIKRLKKDSEQGGDY